MMSSTACQRSSHTCGTTPTVSEAGLRPRHMRARPERESVGTMRFSALR